MQYQCRTRHECEFITDVTWISWIFWKHCKWQQHKVAGHGDSMSHLKCHHFHNCQRSPFPSPNYNNKKVEYHQRPIHWHLTRLTKENGHDKIAHAFSFRCCRLALVLCRSIRLKMSRKTGLLCLAWSMDRKLAPTTVMWCLVTKSRREAFWFAILLWTFFYSTVIWTTARFHGQLIGGFFNIKHLRMSSVTSIALCEILSEVLFSNGHACTRGPMVFATSTVQLKKMVKG